MECFLYPGLSLVGDLIVIFGGEAALARSGPNSVSVEGKGIVIVAI